MFHMRAPIFEAFDLSVWNSINLHYRKNNMTKKGDYQENVKKGIRKVSYSEQ